MNKFKNIFRMLLEFTLLIFMLFIILHITTIIISGAVNSDKSLGEIYKIVWKTLLHKIL